MIEEKDQIKHEDTKSIDFSILSWKISIDILPLKISEEADRYRSRALFAFLTISSIVLSIIVYFSSFPRGLYMDDYANLTSVINPVTSKYIPLFDVPVSSFPARYFGLITTYILTALASENEWLTRLLMCFGVVLLALVSAALTYRITRSKLSGLITGALLIVPAIGYEATLWIGASAYIFGIISGVFFLHAVWGAVSSEEMRVKNHLAVFFSYIVALLYGEWLISVLFIAYLFPFLASFQKHERIYASKDYLFRTLFIIGLTLVPSVILYITSYRNGLAKARGGLALSPDQVLVRATQFIEGIYRLFLSPDWGGVLQKEVIYLGLDTLKTNFVTGSSIFLIFSVLFLITLFSGITNNYEKPPYGISIFILSFVLWSVIALLIPAILVNGQIIEYRMFYLPFVAISIAIGMLSALFSSPKKRKNIRFRQLSLVVVFFIVIYNILGTLGYSRTFELRHQLDEAQIMSISKHVPGISLTQKPPVFFVIRDREKHPVDYAPKLSFLLFGVFETPWSAKSSLEKEYRRNDIQAITVNKWVLMNINTTKDTEGNEIMDVNGQKASVSDLILIDIVGEEARLIDSVSIIEINGIKKTIALPMAQVLRARGAGETYSLDLTTKEQLP